MGTRVIFSSLYSCRQKKPMDIPPLLESRLLESGLSKSGENLLKRLSVPGFLSWEKPARCSRIKVPTRMEQRVDRSLMLMFYIYGKIFVATANFCRPLVNIQRSGR